MKVKDFLKSLEAARAVARNETSAMSERSELASALASEGYVGGYIAALNDVQAILTHGHPADPRLYWDAARQDEIRAINGEQ
jgi:hypothetical protein